MKEETISPQTMDVDTEETKIVVYLCGAVANPGIYVLEKGSRINDVLEMAGGFVPEACVTSVNLAEKLEDADMIYIPTEEEVKQEGLDFRTGAVNTAENQFASKHLININTADKTTLCSLPGIGESRAEDIITYREKHGAFQKTEDIMKVAGIKESLYEKISDLISVR